MGKTGKAIVWMFSVLALQVSTPALAETLVFETGNANKISFYVDHPAHAATFVSSKLTFGAEIDGLREGKPVVAAIDEIRVAFKSFDSGNANRDSNAMEAMNAFKHPYMVFAPTDASLKPVTTTADGVDAKVTLTGDMTVSGTTRQNQKIEGWLHTDYKTWSAKGRFAVKCSDYKIERPALLFVPIKDEVAIWFNVGGTVVAAAPAPAPAPTPPKK